jgi:hypothetical protein
MWISDAIDSGLVLTSRAAHHSSGAESATEWLRSNYDHIPEDLRPRKQAIHEFAAFFSTYLTSSFDVLEKPGSKGEGPIPRFGCTCEVCARIINAPHLQAKKLYARDKRRADILMIERLRQLATENGLEIEEQPATQIVRDQQLRRSAAYLAYGHWLILRLTGESDGPAVLALWRLIAWDPRGGMRREFTLKLDDFKFAEKSVLSAIQDAK